MTPGRDAMQDCLVTTPISLEQIVNRALGDVPTALRPRLAVRVATDAEGNRWYSFEEKGEAGYHESRLPPSDDVESFVVALADVLQDDVMGTSWGYVWPICPGHPHPAAADLRGGRAVWVCPKSRELIGEIGQHPSLG